MGFKPNFTDATLSGGVLRVHGTSEDDDLTDIASIQVTVSQGDRIASGPVDTVVPEWIAELRVGDTFTANPAIVSGVEIHFRNFQTISWTQTIKIRSPT